MKSKAWKSDKWSIYLSVTQIKKEEFGESGERERLERSPCNDTMENEVNRWKNEQMSNQNE